MLVDGDEEVALFATNNEILASNFRATHGEMTFDSSARRIKGAAAEEVDRTVSNERSRRRSRRNNDWLAVRLALPSASIGLPVKPQLSTRLDGGVQVNSPVAAKD